MNTLQAMWQSYADQVLPRDAPTIQRVECRRAFYAGAQAFLGLMTGPVADASEDAGVAMIEGYRQELAVFVVDVRSDLA